MDIIKELLKRPIAYQPIIAKAFGSTDLAIFWGQLYYWTPRSNNEGWIYKTRDEIYDETGLKRSSQETARRMGKELGVLEEKLAGRPAKMHYRIDIDRATELIGQWCSSNNQKEEIKEIKPRTSNKKEKDNRPPLEKMLDGQRHIQIIGLWSKQMGFNIANDSMMESIIKRNLKAAVLLRPYTDQNIIDTINVLKNTDYLKKFTLETVGKFIDNVVKGNNKKGVRIVGYDNIRKEDGSIAMRPMYEKV